MLTETEETMKEERWVKCEFGDLKCGHRVRAANGRKFVYEVLSVGHPTNGEKFAEFLEEYSGKKETQTESGTCQLERLSLGHWKPIKSWDELRVGMEVQWYTKMFPKQKEILSIKSIGNVRVTFENERGHDSRSNFEQGAYSMHQWVEGDETGEEDMDPWKTLKKACTGSEDGWRPKEIPDWPAICPHCKGPAVELLNAVDCKNKCEGSRG
jgi:hypothetical protein